MANGIDIWQWTYADRKNFREAGGSKQTLIDNYEEFWRCYGNDPSGAELAIHQAIDAAKACGDARWELHLRHWRIQNWINQSQVKRMLPEAIDLLDLAVDERVKDIPQRICAYHDVVECYVEIDPAGYYQEIKENAEHILAQLPKCYPCADCARSNLARAAAAAGKVQEAERWLAEHESNRYDELRAAMLNGRGTTYLRMGQWDKAEQAYLEAAKLADKKQEGLRYLSAMLGVAHARLSKGDLAGAQKLMPHIRRNAKYEGGSNLVADLLEVEGYLAEQLKAPQAALDYFTRAAKINDELGCSRNAAEIALHAAEMAREHQISTENEETLTIAARAVGMLPPASQDLYQRLAALGREPLAPVTSAQTSHAETAELLKEQENRKELAGLEELFQAHLQNGHYQGITSALFRLAIWHDSHEQTRAALDYFIWGAALERLSHFSREERSDALHALKVTGNKLPEGAVNAALRAAESSPPTQLLPILTHLPAEQWQWTLQAIATEVTGKPVVEPEPESNDGQVQFAEWVEHSASMTALLVRFSAQADATKRETWANSLDQTAQEIEDQVGEHKDQPGTKELLIFVRNLLALSRGAALAEIAQSTPPPFNQTIAQIGQIAELPVWRHPGNSPLDFMIEQAAQKAVRALRLHDEHRVQRLANLAFRYELMTIDMREQKELENEVRYLEALITLLQHDGQLLPASESTLAEPYAAILSAVAQASLEEE